MSVLLRCVPYWGICQHGNPYYRDVLRIRMSEIKGFPPDWGGGISRTEDPHERDVLCLKLLFPFLLVGPFLLTKKRADKEEGKQQQTLSIILVIYM